MESKDGHPVAAATVDTSTNDSDVTKKLEIWTEILDYLDRLREFAHYDSPNNQEYEAKEAYKGQLYGLKYIAERDLALTRSQDEHGSSCQDLRVWSRCEAEKTRQSRAPGLKVDRDLKFLLNIRSAVIEEIEAELRTVKASKKEDRGVMCVLRRRLRQG